MSDDAIAAPLGASAESAPAPQPEAEKPAGSEQPEAQPKDEQKAEPQDGEAKQSRGVQKRLDELTRRANDAQRVNERLIGVIEKALANGSVPNIDKVPDGPPKRESFSTFEEYLEAKADWQVAQSVSKAQRNAETQRAEREAAQREQAWQARLDAANDKHEDFDEVVRSPHLRITQVMAEAMKDCESGAEIAYHLGKNPKEAARIAELSPVAQVREIGKIEAQLTNKPVRQPSRAPAPIEPVSGGKTATGSPETETQAEYEARRKKEGAWWAGR